MPPKEFPVKILLCDQHAADWAGAYETPVFDCTPGERNQGCGDMLLNDRVTAFPPETCIRKATKVVCGSLKLSKAL